nr:basic proline-rich protein-like [Vulpes vulpes]
MSRGLCLARRAPGSAGGTPGGKGPGPGRFPPRSRSRQQPPSTEGGGPTRHQLPGTAPSMCCPLADTPSAAFTPHRLRHRPTPLRACAPRPGPAGPRAPAHVGPHVAPPPPIATQGLASATPPGAPPPRGRADPGRARAAPCCAGCAAALLPAVRARVKMRGRTPVEAAEATGSTGRRGRRGRRGRPRGKEGNRYPWLHTLPLWGKPEKTAPGFPILRLSHSNPH